jgi:hypothetical protein
MQCRRPRLHVRQRSSNTAQFVKHKPVLQSATRQQSLRTWPRKITTFRSRQCDLFFGTEFVPNAELPLLWCGSVLHFTFDLHGGATAPNDRSMTARGQKRRIRWRRGSDHVRSTSNSDAIGASRRCAVWCRKRSFTERYSGRPARSRPFEKTSQTRSSINIKRERSLERES